jgi:hypothetical protein
MALPRLLEACVMVYNWTCPDLNTYLWMQKQTLLPLVAQFVFEMWLSHWAKPEKNSVSRLIRISN